MANELSFTFPIKELASALIPGLIEHLLPHLDGLRQQETKQSNKKSESLITRKEAAAKLRISLPTLDKWTSEGKLIGYRIARQVRYKESELMGSISQMQTCN